MHSLISLNGHISQTIGNLTIILLFLIPILTSKTFSKLEDENFSITSTNYINYIKEISSIVIGKFLAICSILLIGSFITMIYSFIFYKFTKIYFWELFITYIGFLLLQLCFITIGMLISCIFNRTILTNIFTFIFIIIMLFSNLILNRFTEKTLIERFSLINRSELFTSGILDLSSIIYLTDFIVFVLYLMIYIKPKIKF